jgi:hypothetical protein
MLDLDFMCVDFNYTEFCIDAQEVRKGNWRL